MNILYINKVSPRLGGGAELRLLEIGRRLVDRGHSVHVICSKTEPGLPNYEQIEGINTHYLNVLPDLIFHFKQFSFYVSRYLFYPTTVFLGGLISRISPDIIVDYVSPSASFISLWAKHFHIPCVAEIMEYRGSQWLSLKSPVTALLGLVSERFLRRFQYARIIAISNFTKQELEQAGFAASNTTVVPCGVDTSKFQNKFPTEKRSDKLLIVVNRLVPLKGHKYLLDALGYVLKVIPDAQLLVVGEGPIRSELELYTAQQGLKQNVKFVGRVAENEKADLLWRSTIFVTPSLQEGFGIVLLEAMACGLPIVAFDLPVYREIIDVNCGFLITKGDTEAMATQIIRLLQDDELRKKISSYNLNRVQQFDWDNMAELEEKILCDLVIKSSST